MTDVPMAGDAQPTAASGQVRSKGGGRRQVVVWSGLVWLAGWLVVSAGSRARRRAARISRS
jgi:hypothetical protein